MSHVARTLVHVPYAVLAHERPHGAPAACAAADRGRRCPPGLDAA